MIGQWAHRAAPTVAATVIAVGAVVAVTDIAEHGGSSGPQSAGTAAPAPSPGTVTRSPRRTVATRAKPPSGPVLAVQFQPSEAVTAPANRTPAPHRTSPAPRPTRTAVPTRSPAPSPVPSPTVTHVPPSPAPSPSTATPTSAPATPPAQPTCTVGITVLGVGVCAGLRTGG
jgi:hypothetical protein